MHFTPKKKGGDNHADLGFSYITVSIDELQKLKEFVSIFNSSSNLISILSNRTRTENEIELSTSTGD